MLRRGSSIRWTIMHKRSCGWEPNPPCFSQRSLEEEEEDEEEVEEDEYVLLGKRKDAPRSLSARTSGLQHAAGHQSSACRLPGPSLSAWPKQTSRASSAPAHAVITLVTYSSTFFRESKHVGWIQPCRHRKKTSGFDRASFRKP
ncbi:unnamed protein product [Prorocentrum cordatum]|uniref:Uncharacterized protein n=1 Tax=Prorocentrum cordatum TaxID=2364126 RepID=A0ABN9WUL3_9DINO|nr:unnamed protein product [Polarella glacialis]